GEYGFGLASFSQTSFVRREGGKDFGGTTTGLWAIAAAVYLALLGPDGMRELGESIVRRSHYAAARLDELPGLRAPALDGPFFKASVVDFGGTGKSVGEINRRLREHGILGGHDLGGAFPELGRSALYCVTELHGKSDIDALVDAIADATRR